VSESRGKSDRGPRVGNQKGGHSGTYDVGVEMNVGCERGWSQDCLRESFRLWSTNTHKEKSTALLRFVIVCKAVSLRPPYLKVVGIKNGSECILIPGSASIHMDGTSVATIKLSSVSPHQVFDLPLG
jgi:hypothetical protein